MRLPQSHKQPTDKRRSFLRIAGDTRYEVGLATSKPDALKRVTTERCDSVHAIHEGGATQAGLDYATEPS
jgi:hypothetical protein